MPVPERLSIELTNRCRKACPFCYNRSGPQGQSAWSPEEVVALVRDSAASGTRAVSFGGGEPLEYEGLFEVLARLEGLLFRSVTTSGLGPCRDAVDDLARARPDKVHVSIHFPGRRSEVDRVIGQVHSLQERGVRAGVNLLVRASQLAEARRAAQSLRAAGIGNGRIVFLPMRGGDTPSAAEVASVAAPGPFQSTSCLRACGPSPRFCALDSQMRVAWCSYTPSRRRLEEASSRGLLAALDGLDLAPCALGRTS